MALRHYFSNQTTFQIAERVKRGHITQILGLTTLWERMGKSTFWRLHRKVFNVYWDCGYCKCFLPFCGLSFQLPNGDFQRAYIFNCDKVQFNFFLNGLTFLVQSIRNLCFPKVEEVFGCIFFYTFNSFSFCIENHHPFLFSFV